MLGRPKWREDWSVFSNLQTRSASTYTDKLPSWTGHSHRPPARRVPVWTSSHLTVRLLYQKALQWWLGMPRTAGKSDHYLGKSCKSSFPPAGTPVRKLPSFSRSKSYRHEEWNWNIPTTQIQGFTWWSQIQSHGPHFRLYSPQAFSRNTSFFSFVCFLQTPELGGSLGIMGCYHSKERKLLPF